MGLSQTQWMLPRVEEAYYVITDTGNYFTEVPANYSAKPYKWFYFILHLSLYVLNKRYIF